MPDKIILGNDKKKLAKKGKESSEQSGMEGGGGLIAKNNLHHFLSISKYFRRAEGRTSHNIIGVSIYLS